MSLRLGMTLIGGGGRFTNHGRGIGLAEGWNHVGTAELLSKMGSAPLPYATRRAGHGVRPWFVGSSPGASTSSATRSPPLPLKRARGHYEKKPPGIRMASGAENET